MKTGTYVKNLKCILCNAEYEPSNVDYVCPLHGYDGRLDVIYDYEEIKKDWNRERLKTIKDSTIWRYAPLLPVNNDHLCSHLPVGWTPLYHAVRLGNKLGLANLYIKNDTLNPTSSLKDRASIIAVAKAIEQNRSVITAASSGNTAASLAGIAASVGLRSVLFVPKSTPKAKIAQMSIYGATVLLVDGPYDIAFELCLKASDEFGWYSRNSGYNPYLSEGKKTVILEILEQLEWETPERIFIPVGDGCILGGVGKGIKDLLALGWIEKAPQLMGVEAEGAAALYNTWKKGGEDIEPVKAHTLADSIAVGLPRDGIKALRAARETKGEFIKVSDKEIIGAERLLAEYAGIFAEPAASSSLAGLVYMIKNKRISSGEKVVILITGNGLKDIKSALMTVKKPLVVEPNFTSVVKAINNAGNII